VDTIGARFEFSELRGRSASGSPPSERIIKSHSLKRFIWGRTLSLDRKNELTVGYKELLYDVIAQRHNTLIKPLQ